MSVHPAPASVSRTLIVMGVSGSGKTTIGKILAERLGAAFIEADDLHPIINIEAMRKGRPLTDQMRWPWLAAIAEAALREPGPVVVSCSALRRAYRDLLRARLPGVTFMHLSAPPEALRARMNGRKGHFMPESLLDSQLETFEPLTGEPHIAIDVSGAKEEAINAALAALVARPDAQTQERRRKSA